MKIQKIHTQPPSEWHKVIAFSALSSSELAHKLIKEINHNPLLDFDEKYDSNVFVPYGSETTGNRIENPKAEDENVFDESILNPIDASDETIFPEVQDTTEPIKQFLNGAKLPSVLVPDIIAEKEQEKWSLTLNKENLHIKLNSENLRLLSHQRHNKKIRRYLKAKIKSARDFLNHLTLRENILLQLCEKILILQDKSACRKEAYFTPLSFKKIATQMRIDKLELTHLIENKYIQLPEGIFPLTYFFNEKKIFQLIRNILKKESPKRPLSDQQIANKLKKEYNFKIARRTISKYREKLGILSSKLRRNSRK